MGFLGAGKVRTVPDMYAYCLITMYKCAYIIFNDFNPKDMH